MTIGRRTLGLRKVTRAIRASGRQGGGGTGKEGEEEGEEEEKEEEEEEGGEEEAEDETTEMGSAIAGVGMVLIEETVEVDDGRGGKAKGWGEGEMEEEIEVEKKAEEAREEEETEEGEEFDEREEAIEGDDDFVRNVSVPPIAEARLLVDAARTEDTLLFFIADATLLRVTDNEGDV